MVDVGPIRERIFSTLNSSPCRRIDFRINGVRIYWGSYFLVMTALAPSPVPGHHFRPLRIAVENPGPNAAAAYRPRTNTFVFPNASSGSTPAEQQTIVHESTHAALDNHRSGMARQDDEAAAYIAEALFVRYTEDEDTIVFLTPDQRNLLVPPATPSFATGGDAIWRSAREIARGIYRTPGVNVTDNELAPLRRAIRTAPSYRYARRVMDRPSPHRGVRF